MARARTVARLIAGAGLQWLVWVSSAAAQGAALRPVARLDLIARENPTAQLGVGASVLSGTYLRVEGILAAGAGRVDDELTGTARGDLVGRFLLDPFGESRHALHGIAGASLMYDGARWTPRLVAGLGLEGPRRAGARWSTELVIGGGVRLGFVMRRARRTDERTIR